MTLYLPMPNIFFPFSVDNTSACERHN